MALSKTALRLLGAFKGSVRAELCGADMMKSVGIGSGTLYPLLLKLEREGILASRWEEVDPSEAGRPRKRLYNLTGKGYRAWNEEVAAIGGGVWVPQS